MEITTNKGKTINVVAVSDWMPVTKIPGVNSKAYNELVDKFGMPSGCYQFAKTEHVEDIGKELIHKEIGYTGTGKDVFGRTGNVRSPSGKHGVNRVIRAEGWDKENDVRVRYLFCEMEDAADLENHIFAESQTQFGYRFAWKEASAGTDGTLHEWMDTAELKLSAEDIIECLPKLRQLVIDKKMEDVISEVDGLFESAIK